MNRPPSWNETVRPRDSAQSRPLRQRPLNRETLSDRLAPLTIPLHHEAHGTSASVTTTRKPAPGPHATRVIERTQERDTVAESHFQCDPSGWANQYVVSLCHTVSHNINTALLQYAPNLLSLLQINTTNANATVDITITVLHDFKLKRDTVQTKNDLPAQ